MKITISREIGARRVVSDALIKHAVRTALRTERSGGSVNVLLCSRSTIRKLNREFREVDRVTDVLSFPDGERGGDIAICVSRIRAQAREYGHSLERETAYLTVHSVLHLLGYDHINGGSEAKRMRTREEEIMTKLGQKR